MGKMLILGSQEKSQKTVLLSVALGVRNKRIVNMLVPILSEQKEESDVLPNNPSKKLYGVESFKTGGKMPKISDNRIVCPVNVWRYFTGQKANTGCTRVACCYECSKEICIGGSGCNNEYKSQNGYPESCDVYPLTFGEAKRIFTFCALFDERWTEHPSMGYVYFLEAVEVYIRAKKEKK